MNKAVLKGTYSESGFWKGARPLGSGADIFQCYICAFLKVPAEEADILSKLLAEVASLPNVVQEPAAAKVSGGILCCPEFCWTIWV